MSNAFASSFSFLHQFLNSFRLFVKKNVNVGLEYMFRMSRQNHVYVFPREEEMCAQHI